MKGGSNMGELSAADKEHDGDEDGGTLAAPMLPFRLLRRVPLPTNPRVLWESLQGYRTVLKIISGAR